MRNNIVLDTGRVRCYLVCMDDKDIRRYLSSTLSIVRGQQTRIEELESGRDALLAVLQSLVPSFDTAYQSQAELENDGVSSGDPSFETGLVDLAIAELNN